MNMPTPLGPHSESAQQPRSGTGLYLLATGQTICWVGLYYSFAALLLPWERELGWAKNGLCAGADPGSVDFRDAGARRRSDH